MVSSGLILYDEIIELSNRAQINTMNKMAYKDVDVVTMYRKVLYCPSQISEDLLHEEEEKISNWTSSTYLSCPSLTIRLVPVNNAH